MFEHGGARPGAGRLPDQPNRQSREVKLLTQQYAEQAILALAAVMEDPTAPHMAVIKAASVLLDRGHGRPGQYVEAKVNPIDALSDEELKSAIAFISEQLGFGEGGVDSGTDEVEDGEPSGFLSSIEGPMHKKLKAEPARRGSRSAPSLSGRRRRYRC